MNTTLILFLTIAIILIFYSIVISRLSMTQTSALSPITLFTITSIIFINIGFIFNYISYANETWAERALISSVVGLISVNIGSLIGIHIFRTNKQWPAITTIPTKLDITYKVAVMTGVTVYGIVLLYFYLLGYIPLIESLRLLRTTGLTVGLMNVVRVSRDVYINPEANYIPLQGFFESVRYMGLPVVVIWFMHFYRSKIQRTLSIIMILVATILVMATGQRWPLMYLIIAILTYLSWTERDFWAFRRYIVKFGFVAVVLGILLSLILGRNYTEGSSFFGILSNAMADLLARIFFGNNQIPFISYRVFPNHEGWLYGQSWLQNFLAYLPGPLPSYPVTFYQTVTGSSIGYTSPPDFYTEAYINFGMLGVGVTSLLWGIILVWLQQIWLKCKGSLFWLGIATMINTIVTFTALSGVVFSTAGIFVSIFIALLVKSFDIIDRANSFDHRKSYFQLKIPTFPNHSAIVIKK